MKTCHLHVLTCAQRDNAVLRQHVLDLRRAARAVGCDLNASATFFPLPVRPRQGFLRPALCLCARNEHHVVAPRLTLLAYLAGKLLTYAGLHHFRSRSRLRTRASSMRRMGIQQDSVSHNGSALILIPAAGPAQGLEAAMAGGGVKTGNGSSNAAAAAVPAGSGQAAETARQGPVLRGGASSDVGAGTAAAGQTAGAATSVAGAQAAQQGAHPSGGTAASVTDGGGTGAAAVGHASTAILLDDASMAASQVGARRLRWQHMRRTLLSAERVVERWRGSLRQTLRDARGDLQPLSEE